MDMRDFLLSSLKGATSFVRKLSFSFYIFISVLSVLSGLFSFAGIIQAVSGGGKEMTNLDVLGLAAVVMVIQGIILYTLSLIRARKHLNVAVPMLIIVTGVFSVPFSGSAIQHLTGLDLRQAVNSTRKAINVALKNIESKRITVMNYAKQSNLLAQKAEELADQEQVYGNSCEGRMRIGCGEKCRYRKRVQSEFEVHASRFSDTSYQYDEIRQNIHALIEENPTPSLALEFNTLVSSANALVQNTGYDAFLADVRQRYEEGERGVQTSVLGEEEIVICPLPEALTVYNTLISKLASAHATIPEVDIIPYEKNKPDMTRVLRTNYYFATLQWGHLDFISAFAFLFAWLLDLSIILIFLTATNDKQVLRTVATRLSENQLGLANELVEYGHRGRHNYKLWVPAHRVDILQLLGTLETETKSLYFRGEKRAWPLQVPSRIRKVYPGCRRFRTYIVPASLIESLVTPARC